MPMGVIKKKKVKKKKVAANDDPFWGTTKDLVERGAITPFISNFMSTQIFGWDPTDLSRIWAEDFDEEAGDQQNGANKDPLADPSPLSDYDNMRLPRVAQYYSVRAKARVKAKSYYLNTLKSYLLGMAEDETDPDDYDDVEENADELNFSEMAHRLGYPKFAKPQDNPLRLLAELPLPIYMTTSHHQFLEKALSDANRAPVSEIFYWDDSLDRIPSILDEEPDFMPSKERPLVYHLYGLDKYPESLVLTEDDYLDFLIRVAHPETRHSGQQRGFPSSVIKALAGTPLLLLGYETGEWEFRALFRGIIRATNDSRGNNSNVADGISMQIDPANKELYKNPEQVKEYLEQYFDLSRFKVYWGDVQSCTRELWQVWKG